MTPDQRRAMVAARDPESVRRNQQIKYQRHRQHIDAKTMAFRQAHPTRVQSYHQRSNERFPGRKQARAAVTSALAAGRLIKGPCEVCGEKKAQAHHDDYTRPLDVRWFCAAHHREVDVLVGTRVA